jgi:LysM repeat protein
VRKWTKSACVVIAWGILPLVAVVGSRETSHPAPASISIASSTQATPADDSATLMSVTVAPVATSPASTKTARVATWTVRPGDTLSAIAASFAVSGGWEALYAVNRSAVGPDPDLLRPGTTLTLPGQAEPIRYAVAPGDTLAGIAGALSVAGGWRALYAANRRAIGPDPDLIRPGTILVTPGSAAPATARSAPAPAAPGPGHGQATAPAASAPAASAPAASRTGSRLATSSAAGRTGAGASSTSRPATGGGKATAGVMPGWLKTALLAAALLTLIAFLAEPAVVMSRRRKHGDRTEPPCGAAETRADPRPADDQRVADQHPTVRNPRVIQADYERVVVGYSASDDTVYLLTPPEEDPRAILRAARLVLPEDTYEEVAAYLGVPSGWRE